MIGRLKQVSALAIASSIVVAAQAGEQGEDRQDRPAAVQAQDRPSAQARPIRRPNVRGQATSAQTGQVRDVRAQRLGMYEVTVPAGKILAVEFAKQELKYWVIDSSTGSTTFSVLTVTPPPARLAGSGKGKVEFKLDNAAAVYLTNKQSSTAPNYQVSFTGTASSDGMAGWLMRGSTNERGVFNALRAADNGAPAAQMHRSKFVPLSAQIQSEVRSGIEGWELKMRDLLTKDLVTAQQRTLKGLEFFFPIDGVQQSNLGDANNWLQQANGGSVAMHPWFDQMNDISARFQAKAKADTDAVKGLASTSVFDPKSVSEAVRRCGGIRGFIRENIAMLEGLPENGDTDNDEKDGYVTPRPAAKDAVSREQAQIDTMMDRADDFAAAFEGCLSAAFGPEPTAPSLSADLASYEALASETATLGAEREQAALSYVDYLDTFSEFWEARFSEAEGRRVNGQPPRYAPSRWLSEAERANKLAEGFAGVGQPGVATANNKGFQAIALTVSSIDACADTSWTFDFNISNLNVVIGTPFNDRVQGNDNRNSFEAIFGLWGDDCLNGRDGYDLIAGNWGDDEIHGGDQLEILTGGRGDDRIFAGHGQDIRVPLGSANYRVYLGSLVSGSAGSDELFGNDPGDTPTQENPLAEGYSNLFFGDGLSGWNAGLAGDDVIDTQGGISFAFGQMGNDTIRAPQGGRIDRVDPTNSSIIGAPILFGSIFVGNSGSDTLEGSPYTDLMWGGRDNDTINGGAFIDYVAGGRGNDDVSGDEGTDLVLGGQGDDTLNGNDGADLVIGWAGNDTINGGGGLVDALFGGTGNDDINGNAGIDFAHGGRGEDVVTGGADFNLLLGSAGDDTLQGGGFIDIALGQNGSDAVSGGGGLFDLLVGNAGFDALNGEAGIDVMLGARGDDILFGGADTDLIFGNNGHDIASGQGGIDLMLGNAGSDCFVGGADTDFVFGNAGNDHLAGENGIDILVGNGGNDELRGGEGTDLLFGFGGDDNLLGEAGIDAIIGSGGSDFIQGGPSTDVIFSGVGDDRIDGQGGEDVALSGNGNDTLFNTEYFLAGAGADRIQQTGGARLFGLGGKDNDTIVANGTSLIGVFGGAGNDIIDATGNISFMLGMGQGGDDTIRVPGGDSNAKLLLFGNDGTDRMEASLGNAFILGNKGGDFLSGFTATDPRRDWIWGNRGDDELFGNSNRRDRLYGGWGNDTKTRDAGLGLTPPAPPTAMQPNVIDQPDRSCRLLPNRPAPGATR